MLTRGGVSCCHGGTGIPFGVHCRRRSYGTLSLDVCTVICIVHPVQGNEYQSITIVARLHHTCLAAYILHALVSQIFGTVIDIYILLLF